MKIRTLLALAAAVVAPALLVLPAHAGASSQYYSVVFKNKNSHLCLGVYGASRTQGAKLVQWNCANATSDDVLWHWENGPQLHNDHSGLCLAIYGGDQTGDKAGGKAVQWSCGNSIDQQWHTVKLNAPGDPAGDEVLLVDQAGHCLGIPGSSTTQGVQADAEVCLNQNHSVPGQVWVEF